MHFGDGRVHVHVGEHILAGHERVEEAAAVVALDEFQVLALAGQAIEIGPHFEHAAGLDVEDLVHLFLAEGATPTVKPARPVDQDLQRLRVAADGVHVPQPHERLVQRVVRRPDALAARYPVQVLFGDRADPLAAVLLLAARQFADDVIRLALDFLVAGGGGERCRGREPVAQEVAA